MNKRFLFSFLVFTLSVVSSAQYKKRLIRYKDLAILAGHWNGTLTYIDYTSNKPYSMPAQTIINYYRKRNILSYQIIYPDEPKANSTDTITLSGNGRILNGDTVVSIKRIKKSIEIITEKYGTDGNDNKNALIRHSYFINRDTYHVTKQVKFINEKNWILRNEYVFKRGLARQ
jgi:hypothetical protein